MNFLPDLGAYAGPVLTAYGVSLALIGVLLLWARLRAARVARQLALRLPKGGGHG